MIPADTATEAHGRFVLDRLGPEEFELLKKIDRMNADGRSYDADELEMHEIAMLADMVDLFERNEDGALIGVEGKPIADMRETIAPDDLPDPPDDANMGGDELDALL